MATRSRYFHLKVKMDNAAFFREPAEVADILTKLKIDMQNWGQFAKQDTGVLHDSNGNIVGSWWVTGPAKNKEE